MRSGRPCRPCETAQRLSLPRARLMYRHAPLRLAFSFCLPSCTVERIAGVAPVTRTNPLGQNSGKRGKQSKQCRRTPCAGQMRGRHTHFEFPSPFPPQTDTFLRVIESRNVSCESAQRLLQSVLEPLPRRPFLIWLLVHL